ncbi:DUF431-domain-containing protein [Auriculariales sp. MPI-PUGE-AT-0066]|nr:DUF431-domain-containing protein [Auriculariales sp. MPI-PUGE-AT-0066]
MSNRAFTYVVEHMEDDEPSTSTSSLPDWVKLEYSHMLELAGVGSAVLFTNVSAASIAALQTALGSSAGKDGRSELGTHSEGVLRKMEEHSVPLDKVCLLDPKAELEISPEDGDGRFEWFLFGGILGDDPPRDRTSELRKLGFPSRNLGKVQMTTDTALGVTKIVVQDQIPLKDVRFVDFPTIRFNAKESVEMPFRYIVRDDKPLLPPGMKEHLKKDLDRGFDF